MKSTVLIDSSVRVEVGRKGGDEELKEEVARLLGNSRTAIVWPMPVRRVTVWNCLSATATS
jgi:hypothetical protein